MIALDRRHLIRSGALAAGALLMPRLALARAATKQRFVFIIQRGAADGLATLAPVGDPAYTGLRGALAEDFAGAHALDGQGDGMFALHPALARIGALYGQKQALFLHAVASPYRDRSHFDGQNVLETGGVRPFDLGDGWLNRLMALLPAGEAGALAVSATIPLAQRGGAPDSSYAPSALPEARDDLLARVDALYAVDAQLHGLWTAAMATRAMAGDLAAAEKGAEKGRGAAATGTLAASLLADPRGARVAMIEPN